MQVLRPQLSHYWAASLGDRCSINHNLTSSIYMEIGEWTKARRLPPWIFWMYAFYQSHQRAATKGTKIKIKAVFPREMGCSMLEHYPDPRAQPSWWAEDTGSVGNPWLPERGLPGLTLEGWGWETSLKGKFLCLEIRSECRTAISTRERNLTVIYLSPSSHLWVGCWTVHLLICFSLLGVCSLLTKGLKSSPPILRYVTADPRGKRGLEGTFVSFFMVFLFGWGLYCVFVLFLTCLFLKYNWHTVL